jgi:hypothetical protein
MGTKRCQKLTVPAFNHPGQSGTESNKTRIQRWGLARHFWPRPRCCLGHNPGETTRPHLLLRSLSSRLYKCTLIPLPSLSSLARQTHLIIRPPPETIPLAYIRPRASESRALESIAPRGVLLDQSLLLRRVRASFFGPWPLISRPRHFPGLI